MIPILLLCLCTIATQNYEVYGWIPNLSKNEDLELEKQLKIINKPPIKTIQTNYGGIVDCIDIYKQLAFDNPLLKNHKIQLKPSFEDIQMQIQTNDSFRYFNIGLENDSCPKGSIPVQRTTKEDLVRASRLPNNFGIFSKNEPGVHFAGMRLNFEPVLFGVAGTLSIHNPPVLEEQISSAYIWVTNATSTADANTIHVGWQVYPFLYTDGRTRFFISWNNNIDHTGCLNLQCGGFVQTNSDFVIGGPVNATSKYGGPIVTMSLSLTQDKASNNWWLRVENKNVGYFPAALFSNRLQHASKAGWTGQTKFFIHDGTSPQMGSGHYPDGNSLHSGYISDISFQDRTRRYIGPLRDNLIPFVDNPICYKVQYYEHVRDQLNRAILYGGPGGFCGS